MPTLRTPRLIPLACFLALTASFLRADDPKPKPENTLSIVVEPVKAQTFARPVKFFVNKVIDRSGNPQPMLMLHQRGGVFIDREPVAIVREALESSLKAADLLATKPDGANYLLDVYIFHFGLGESSGYEYFGKVDLNVVLKDALSGKSETITAMGTSIQGTAVRKKNIMKNMEANLEGALQDSLRNFLRGVKLRDFVAAGSAAPAPAASQATAPSTTPTPDAAKPADPAAPVAPSPAPPPPANPPAPRTWR